MKDRLEKWLKANLIQYQTRADLLFIKGWGTAMIQDMSKQEHIFKKDKNGDYVFDCAENYDFLKADDIFYVVFEFGDRFFYVDIREEKMPFHVLKYVGDPVVSDIKCDFYPLGIHSGYELLNGSGSLSTWVKKAKFLGYKGLGICDYNTFAGSLDLQREASSKELRYCFGYSLTMVIGDDKVGAKVYANTQKGFRNILRIQKTINVDREDGLIDYLELLALADGNCLVFDKWSGEWLCNNIIKLDDFVKAFDGFVYFQVDTSEYRAERIDVRVLNSLKAYFDTFYVEPQNYDHDQHPFYYIKNIRPVLIQDMYYVDADDWRNKMVLNKIDIGAAHEQSYMQYMKPLDELYDEFEKLFSEKYSFDVFEDMCEATAEIVENSEACYDLSENYAPRYEMTEMEKLKYGDTHTMFNQLIEDGFKRLVPKGQESIYRERLEYEKYVIESTDNVDYYLVTFDEVNWAKNNGIFVGVGRGSAGGCLLSYLLGITSIDPIKWGLLFERFLLPERGGLEPADVTAIEGDIQSDDYFEISLENGRTYKFDKDAQFKIKRDGKEMTVYADELIESDDIIWDNQNLLFKLNEVGYESSKH